MSKQLINSIESFVYRTSYITIITQFDLTPQIRIEYPSTMTQSEMEITCDKDRKWCSTNVLIFYPWINQRNFDLSIRFDQDALLAQGITQLDMHGISNNPKYILFLLVYRFVLFIISLGFLISYILFIRTVPQECRTFEHRFITLFLVSLTLFNDPLYSLTILKANIASTVISCLFVTFFLSCLIYFWLIMLQRIHKETLSVNTTLADFKVKLITFIFFCITTSGVLIASISSRFYPSIHYQLQYC